FLQYQLVECQIRDRTTKPRILLLQILHPTRLIGLQAAIFLAPPIIGLLADRDPTARLGGRGALRQHNLRFTQLADNLFRAMLLARHSMSPSSSKISSILDHSEGDRSGAEGKAADFMQPAVILE